MDLGVLKKMEDKKQKRILLTVGKSNFIRLDNREKNNFLVLSRYIRILYKAGKKEKLLMTNLILLSRESYCRCHDIIKFKYHKKATIRRMIGFLWAVRWIKIRQEGLKRYVFISPTFIKMLDDLIDKDENSILNETDDEALERYVNYEGSLRRTNKDYRPSNKNYQLNKNE